jgi:GTPase SAR1 family protein
LIVYDITSHKTFEHLETWMEELVSKGPKGMIKLIVGNKSDLAEE